MVNWTATNGSTISISVVDHAHLDYADLVASIDGKVVAVERQPTMLREPRVISGHTVVASVGKIGLTAARLDAVRAMLAEAQMQIDGRPDVQLRKLVRERIDLIERISNYVYAAAEAHESMIEEMSANGYSRLDAGRYDTDLAAARKALAEFDAARPEVKAKMEADKQADIAHFLAVD